MTVLIADASLPDRLKALKEPARVVDDTGRTIGVFQPFEVAPPGVAAARSPYTVEQLQELRQQAGGLPLAEVLKQLGRQ